MLSHLGERTQDKGVAERKIIGGWEQLRMRKQGAGSYGLRQGWEGDCTETTMKVGSSRRRQSPWSHTAFSAEELELESTWVGVSDSQTATAGGPMIKMDRDDDILLSVMVNTVKAVGLRITEVNIVKL